MNGCPNCGSLLWKERWFKNTFHLICWNCNTKQIIKRTKGLK